MRPENVVTAGDEDTTGWLVTFSDLVLQLFGFVVIALVVGAQARDPRPTATPIEAPAPAPVVEPVRRDAPADPVRAAAVRRLLEEFLETWDPQHAATLSRRYEDLLVPLGAAICDAAAARPAAGTP